MKVCKSKQLAESIRTGLERTYQHKRHLLLAAGLVSAAAAMPASAQDAAAAPAASAATDNSGVEVVTVTARKASELVQDVPMSISTMRADQMVKENTTTIREYFAKIPGLNLGRSGSRIDVSIRGITTGSNANPTMAITIDDSPFGSSTGVGGGSLLMPELDPYDLQRIEVLRGPQGTLYGASNLGGLIKYVTAQPNTSQFSGRVQVDGSRVAHGGNGYGVRAGLNIPLVTDKLGLRMSVFDRQDAGWVDDLTTGRADVNKTKVKGGRAALLWTPNDALSVRASVLHQRSQGKGSGGEAVDVDLRPIYGEYVGASMPGTFTYDRRTDFADLVVEYEMPWASLQSTSSFGRTRFEGPQDLSWVFGGLLENIFRAPLGALITAPMSVHKRTQEIRLDSPDDGRKLEWRLGLFYTNEDSYSGQVLTARNRTTGAEQGLPLLLNSQSTNAFEERAAFGVLTYHFTPAFDVQTGFRYSRNKQVYTNSNGGILGGTDPLFTGGSQESKTTYMVTPRYKVAKNLMLYGTVATGYRPGGPNGSVSPTIPRSYQADTTRNLELGMKGQFLDNRLQLDAAVFRIDWDDIQVILRDPATSFSYTANAAGAKSEGIEISGVFYPARGWTISGNTAFTNAVLTSSLGDLSNGRAGDRLPFSAKRTAALSISRDFKLANGWTVTGGASSNYVGERDLGFGESPTDRRYRMPSYTTFALNGGISNKDWSINAYVRNLSDKRGLLYGADAGQIAPSRAFPREQGSLATITPRTIGVSVARSF